MDLGKYEEAEDLLLRSIAAYGTLYVDTARANLAIC